MSTTKQATTSWGKQSRGNNNPKQPDGFKNFRRHESSWNLYVEHGGRQQWYVIMKV
jgi:hypothetical protein